MEQNKKLVRVTTVPISLKKLLKGQHHFMFQNGFDVIGVSSNEKELREVSNEEGVETVAINMTRKISPVQDLVSVWKFYKFCKKEKPTIVHSHTPKAGIVAMLGSKLAGVPIRIHTVAGLPLMETKGIKRSVLNFVEKITYACANKVYPNSTGLYDFILKNKLTHTQKLKVIANGSSNGINTEYFSPNSIDIEKTTALKQTLNITNQDFVFVFVGRLVKDKGINELIKAFLNVSLSLPHIKLLLVGNYEHDLDPLDKTTLQQINSNTNIISAGYQEDVRPYFAISNCLVFPSYREGFPNVVLQAGAMGLPCIVTDINGCNEIIKEGVNGSIVPKKDSIALQNSMQKMVQEVSWSNQLKSNSRKMITSHYEQKFVWNALLQEYQELLNEVKYV